MKCEIIRDLLPLYIDNICSEESRKFVEEHLQECTTCHKLFEELGEDIEVGSKVEDDEVNTCFEEKDLLLKAKRSVRFELIKKIFRGIYTGVICLNILAIIAGYFSIKYGYDLEFPRLYLKMLGIQGYGILFGIAIIPLICSLIGLSVLSKIDYRKKYAWKLVINIITIIICIGLSLISGVIMAFIVPPLESFTENPHNYLVVGKDMKKFESEYKKSFPENIPQDAKNVQYLYRKYNAIFSTDAVISASWSLPAKSYEYYKTEIENKSELKEIEKGKYEVYLKTSTYPDGLKLNFEYDDNKKEVKYIALIEENH